MTPEQSVVLKRCAQFAKAAASDLAQATVPAREFLGPTPPAVLRRNALETLDKVVLELEALVTEEPTNG